MQNNRFRDNNRDITGQESLTSHGDDGCCSRFGSCRLLGHRFKIGCRDEECGIGSHRDFTVRDGDRGASVHLEKGILFQNNRAIGDLEVAIYFGTRVTTCAHASLEAHGVRGIQERSAQKGHIALHRNAGRHVIGAREDKCLQEGVHVAGITVKLLHQGGGHRWASTDGPRGQPKKTSR